MDEIKNIIEETIIDGLVYLTSNPKKVFTTIAMAAWTMFVYRSGCRKGLASVMKKSGILIVCENQPVRR